MTSTTMDIGKLDLNKVDNAVMVKAARKYLKKEFADKGKRTTASALHKHFGGLGESVTLIECNDCGGLSDESLPACPYCGATDEEETTVKAKKQKDKADALATTNGTNGTNGHATDARASVEDAAAVVLRIEDLDAAVAEAQRIKGDGASWAWRLGKHVYEKIYAPELWTQRRDEVKKDRPRYTSFNQFCEQELGYSKTFIYLMMEVSQKLTEDEARKFGTKHLEYLISAPKDSQVEIKQLVAAGATTREVAEAVKEARAKAGMKQRPGVGKSGKTKKATAAAAERAPRRKGITCILPEGRQQVKLFAKPASKKDEPKPARRVGDKPYGRIECSNGVDLYVAVSSTPSGQLVVNVEAKRVEREETA